MIAQNYSWPSAAIDACSPEIHDPDNGQYDNDRGQTEAQHEPDIMPGHAPSSLARRYDRTLLLAFGSAFGRTHDVLDVLLISKFPTLIAFLHRVRAIASSERRRGGRARL